MWTECGHEELTISIYRVVVAIDGGGAFPFRHTPHGTGQPAQAAANTQPVASQREDRAQVDPKLVHKKVVVQLRDGRLYEGKLVELTDDFLRLKMGKATEKVMLTEVATVERQRRSGKRLFIVIGAIAAGFVIATIVVNAKID